MSELNPELAENPEPRCACVLLLDTSGSMAGERIASLNEGLLAFQQSVASDRVASLRVEVAVVSFDSEVRTVQEFVGASEFAAPTLSASGLTLMASGIEKALDLVAERNRVYDANKIASYRPWIFMITDGKPEGPDPVDLEKVRARLHAAEASKRVAFFAVGTASADFTVLSRLCTPDRPPQELMGVKFSEMFLWLSRSLGNSVSRSVKEPQQVPFEPRSGWSVLR